MNQTGKNDAFPEKDENVFLGILIKCLLFQKKMKTVFIVILFWGGILCLDFNYHDNESMKNFLQNMSNIYPNLTKLYSVGKTVESKYL